MAQLRVNQTGAGLKFQLELRIPADVRVPEVERELLRAVLLEMIYRAQPDLPAGTRRTWNRRIGFWTASSLCAGNANAASMAQLAKRRPGGRNDDACRNSCGKNALCSIRLRRLCIAPTPRRWFRC